MTGLDGMGLDWIGLDISQTTTTTRAPLAVLINPHLMFYQGVEQLIWSRYLSKVSKILFLDKVFHYNNPTKKKLRDFLGICFKICTCSKVQLTLVCVKM